jgi:hypothetical protein
MKDAIEVSIIFHEGQRMFAVPKQSAPVALTDGVTVPMAVLEAAEASLGSFCSDHGWSNEDMQNMDNLSAYIAIARHKANLGITKGQPAVPDAITDDSESLEYRTGWNDCRQAMLEMMK